MRQASQPPNPGMEPPELTSLSPKAVALALHDDALCGRPRGELHLSEAQAVAIGTELEPLGASLVMIPGSGGDDDAGAEPPQPKSDVKPLTDREKDGLQDKIDQFDDEQLDRAFEVLRKDLGAIEDEDGEVNLDVDSLPPWKQRVFLLFVEEEHIKKTTKRRRKGPLLGNFDSAEGSNQPVLQAKAGPAT